jgi:hypothetical protein
VDAGVDLNKLGKDDVRVKGKNVTINLPDARILGSSLDEYRIRLYDRDRGLLTIRGNYALIEEARRDAEDRIVAARDNGIVEQVQNNAEDSIRGFLIILGYKEVVLT